MVRWFYKIISAALLLLVYVEITSFTSKRNTGEVVIELKNYVGNQPLQLDQLIYKNELGQQYSISKFRYYIGNIQLKNKNGSEYTLPDYFLIDEDEPQSKRIAIKNVPPGDYTSISFIIGVDSMHNCSGAQTGALDPVNGMFWTWNTGYIFLKLEGKSADSKSPGNMFEYHIGGYKAPANCIRNVTLDFNKPIKTSVTKDVTIKIKTDASQILKSPTVIDFSKLSSVTDFHNATTIANNYKGMFNILSSE